MVMCVCVCVCVCDRGGEHAEGEGDSLCQWPQA